MLFLNRRPVVVRSTSTTRHSGICRRVSRGDTRKFAEASALDLDRQRAIISALVTITVNPTGRGRAFDRHSVDIVFR